MDWEQIPESTKRPARSFWRHGRRSAGSPWDAAITPAYHLNARYVIHTVGPAWEGGWGEEKQLRSCYDNALQLALEHRCRSVAFPLISTGNYGFPRDKALQIAIAAFSDFLLQQEMAIYLVVFDHASFRLSEKLFQSVESYIDQNYVKAWEQTVHGAGERIRRLPLLRRREMDLEATRDLIGRAGYALTNSSKFDLIIRYFIEQGNYNVVEINCVLFEYDQSLLGS